MSSISPLYQLINNPLHLSLYAWLEYHAKHTPNAPAILAPARPVLTYNYLYNHVTEVAQALYAMGLRRHDHIAVVLPSGPEMVTAFLAVSALAACAPLNPAYSPHEFAFYLAAMRTKAVIIQQGMASPARAIAQVQGFPVLEISPGYEAAAGLFTFVEQRFLHSALQEYAQPDDVALALHTSGTLSQPKIVPLTQRNLCTAAHNMQLAFALTASDRCLNVLPFFHLHAIQTVILASLVAGASMVCPPQFSTPQFFVWLEQFRPTWYTAVPTIHQEIVDYAAQTRTTYKDSSLRFVRSGSAALPARVRVALETTFAVPVIETYGATEASGHITCNPPPVGPWKAGSVGAPVGPEVGIMDATGNLLSVGAVGEVVTRGITVIQGYENDPVSNAIAFIHGWFRTGDEGYLDTDGYLFVTGRIKEIINRGGSKVSPQEVDDVLLEHEAVAQAATFAVPHVRLGEDVVSAVILHQDAAVTAQELRRFVGTRLSSFKVPSRVWIVENLPVNPIGKVQRNRLAEQLGLTSSSPPLSIVNTAEDLQHTPLEEVLVGIWSTVLNLQHVDVHDDFFQLGGDSLVATRLLSRIRDVTHIELSFQSFFETPTIAEIARDITRSQQTAFAHPNIPHRAVSRVTPLPLSYSQQRLWFLEQLGMNGHAYNLLNAIRLYGPLQVSALEHSLQDMVSRHEVLRTKFATIAGEPRQSIEPELSLSMPVEDLRHLSSENQEAHIRLLAQAMVQRPYDLAHGPLIRVTLLRISELEHVLLLALHHIVSDGWSHGIFWRELACLYEALVTGQPYPLPALAIQYADFASWQQQWLQGEILNVQLAYWRRQLIGAPTLQLPTDYLRPAVQTSRGARQFLTVSAALTQRLKRFSQQHEVTLFMTLLAALQVLLQRYAGQDDIVIGSLIANRNRAEVEPLIGFFVNTVVLRTDLSGDPSFQDLLVRVREVTLGAYQNQDIPYEKLLEELRPLRDLSHNPLFQVMCVLHNTPQYIPEFAGLRASPLELDPGTARFDITLDWYETAEGLLGRFEYNTDLFSPDTVARMAAHLHTLLEAVVAHPEQRLSQLPLLIPDERRQILVDWNATTVPYPTEQCLHSMFEVQVQHTPGAVAVVCAEASLTYDTLNRRANQVANYLCSLGIGTEMLVGLCYERSGEMVIGLLGILKAGAAYVPLDPTYPQERLGLMLEDAQPSMVLTQERFLRALPVSGVRTVCLDTQWALIAQYSEDNPINKTTSGNLAYLLYTSGSTGEPKGVLGIHRATLNVLAWLWQAYPFAGAEVCCHHISLSFTDSIQELFAPLLQGIPIVLIPQDCSQDLGRFVRTLAEYRVTRLLLVPSLLRTMVETYPDLQERLPDLQLWFSSGEALPSDLYQRCREIGGKSRLVNLYGASETSANTTWYDTSLAPLQQATVPIGRPIANTQVYVLDASLQPVPIGVPGELYVGGASLTRGYHRHPELTAERFLPHPFSADPQAYLYKTGDLVRYRADGNLDYLGRFDQQVKWHGVRIALGEVETTLAQHPEIRQAAVFLHEVTPGEARLVAYFVPAQQPGPSYWECRDFLARRLPLSMLPTAFVALTALPYTANGKIDRQALPEPLAYHSAAGHYVAPRNPREEQVAAIWCQLMNLEQVGIHDNFFELGGHSLLAMKLLFRVWEATKIDIPLMHFFTTPTVSGMVVAMESLLQQEPEERQGPVPIPRDRVFPASIAQEHFWLFDQALPDFPLFDLPHKGVCNISYRLRLQGALNLALLEQSFNEVIKRHEILRTTFKMVDAQLLQEIAPAMALLLSVEDLGGLPASTRASAAQRRIQEERQRPFRLTQGPLLRAHVWSLGEQEYHLLVTIHHIICDGVALGILVREVAAFYDAFAAGEIVSLPPVPIQYADFAVWQRRWQHHATMRAQLAYWQEQLRAPFPVLALPTDRPHDTVLPTHIVRQAFELPPTLCQALQHVSQREGLTLFMTYLAAFKTLLYAYTEQEDVRVATLVANRTWPATENMLGLLVNTVLLRTDLSNDPTLKEVLERVRKTTIAAYTHQDLPFEDIVRVLEHDRDFARASLAQAMIIWHSTLVQEQLLPQRMLRIESMGLHMEGLQDALTTFDIVLILSENLENITATFLYQAELFDAETIRRMFEHFRYVLECFIRQSGQALSALRHLRDSRSLL